MRIGIIALVAISALSSGTAIADEYTAVCNSCQSDYDYQQAAISAILAPRGFHTVLVANPAAGDSRWVEVSLVPDGEVPVRFVDAQVSAGTKTGPAPVDQIISLGAVANSGTGRRTSAGMDATANGTTAIVSRTSDAERAEVDAVFKMTKAEMTLILPQDDYFKNYTERNSEATHLKIYNKLTEFNPAWAGRSLWDTFKRLIIEDAKREFGKDARICVIFNNGDSACYPIPMYGAPTINEAIPGTIKTVEGSGLGGGGGGDGMVVDYAPPSVNYGPRGGTGSRGEMWLFCTYIGGKLSSCYIEVIR